MADKSQTTGRLLQIIRLRDVMKTGAYFWFWHDQQWKVGHYPEGSFGFIETWDETIDSVGIELETPAIALDRPEALK